MSELLMRFHEGAAYLQDRGLNLLGVLDVATLPAAVREPLAAAGLELAAYQRLVVIGHAGRRLWAELTREPFHSSDPVDDYSRAHTAHFASHYLDDTGWRLLYPGDVFFPLNLLGELVSWGRPSPLGLGIHPEYGLWWAYRTVFLSQLRLPVTTVVPAPHPCDGCVGQPCLAACPAGALSATAGFDVYACLR
jgi:epoxyqueuosine reductase